MQIDEDSAKVKFPPPFIFLGGLVAGILIGWLLDIPSFDMDETTKIVAAGALLVVGFGIGLAAMSVFRRRGTNVEPWRASTMIVAEGVFRWTRNPMYLGMTLVYCGLAILFESFAAFLLLPFVLIIIRTYVIAREERYLETKFGDEYRRYRQRVRRWI